MLPAFLLFGFAVDAVTLRRVDLLPETILVYSYLTLSGVAIFLTHLYEEKVWRGNLADRVAPFLPFATQYAFGSLFSAYLIFYTKSASITDSWPFIAVLFGVILGLELLKEYRHRFVLYLSVFFTGLLSFSIFAVPLWTGSLGGGVFALSVALSLTAFSVFLALLYLTGKRKIAESFQRAVASVAVIVTVISTLYVANVLPPIPLALKDIGVYQSVLRENGSYRLVGEAHTFFERMFGMTVRTSEGEPLYVFSSVFAPVRINTDIVHRWEYRDTGRNRWIESTVVSFPASGGRDGGYRGFSLKRGLTEGLWRVSVETPDGRKIGRVEFRVEHGPVRTVVETIR